MRSKENLSDTIRIYVKKDGEEILWTWDQQLIYRHKNQYWHVLNINKNDVPEMHLDLKYALYYVTCGDGKPNMKSKTVQRLFKMVYDRELLWQYTPRDIRLFRDDNGYHVFHTGYLMENHKKINIPEKDAKELVRASKSRHVRGSKSGYNENSETVKRWRTN